MTGPRVEPNRYLQGLERPNRYLSALDAEPEPEKPGILESAGKFALDVIKAPFESAREMLGAQKVLGEYEVAPPGVETLPEERPRVAGIGGAGAKFGRIPSDYRRITAENTPDAISPEEAAGRRALGLAQTVVNVGSGGIASAVERAALPVAGKLASRVAGGLASGAAGGAVYAPDDPLAGAALGAGLGAAGAAILRPKPPAIPPEGPRRLPAGERVSGSISSGPQNRPAGLLPEKAGTDFVADATGGVKPTQARPVGEVGQPRRISSGSQNRYVALIPEKTGTDFVADATGGVNPTQPRPRAEGQGPRRLISGRGPFPRALLPEKSGARDVQRFDDARAPAGARRPVTATNTDALIRELNDTFGRMEDAAQRSQYAWVRDENLHIMDTDKTIPMATGKGPVSRQAKGMRNWDDQKRIADEITEELRARGLSDEDIYEQIGKLADEKPTTSFDDYFGTTAFDIGGAARAALKHPLGQNAALFAGGKALEDASEGNEPLEFTGRGIQILAAARAARPYVKQGATKAGEAIRSKLVGSEGGRKFLNFLSHDFTADPKVRELVKGYEEMVSKGRARAAEMRRLAQSQGPQGDRRISDIIEGEVWEQVGNDAPAVLAAAQKISDEFTELGRQKVSAGLLREGTVKAREGRYLPRRYAAFEGSEALPQSVTKGSRKIRVQGDKQRIDDLPQDFRKGLGEIREASYRAGEGLEKGYRDVAAAKLLNDLTDVPGAIEPQFWSAITEARTAKALASAARETGDGQAASDAMKAFRDASARAKAAPVPKGYKRMPDVKGLGELRGAVVREDVADYLNMLPEMGSPRNIFGAALSYWKRAHTMWNPGTHMGNTLSNSVMAHMGGLNLLEQPKFLRKAMADWKLYGADSRFLAEKGILERGLPTFGDRPMGGAGKSLELRRLAATSRPETRAVLAKQGVTAPGKLREAGRKAMGGIEQAYAMEDGVYRVALFKKLTQGGMGKDEAAEYVRKQFVDYSTRSPLLTGIKNTVSPFILFPAKAIPRTLDQIVEHPVRWMTLAAAWGALDQASRKTVGEYDEDDLRPNQRMSRMFGYLLPGTTQLPFKGKEGEKYALDFARWTPLSALTGSPVPGSLATALGENVPGILQPGGPIIDMAARAINRDPFTGDEWMLPADSPGDKAGKIAGAAAGLTLPSALSFHLPRVAGDIKNKAEAKTVATDALGFAGLRPTTIRPGMRQAGAAAELQRRIAEERKAFAREMRKADHSAERQAELQRRFSDRVERLIQNFRNSGER